MWCINSARCSAGFGNECLKATHTLRIMVTQVVVGALEISAAHVNLLTWEETPTNERYPVCVCVCFVTQLYLTLCDHMDCNLPGYFIHGLLEWVSMPSYRGSSRPRDQNPMSLTYPALADWFFTTSTIWKVTLTIAILITKRNQQRTQNTKDTVPSKFLMCIKEDSI